MEEFHYQTQHQNILKQLSLQDTTDEQSKLNKCITKRIVVEKLYQTIEKYQSKRSTKCLPAYTRQRT